MIDPTFSEHWKKGHAMNATLRIWVLVDGQLLNGLPASDKRFAEDANSWLDETSEELRGLGMSAKQIEGLRFEVPASDADEPEFVTLTDASLIFPGQNIQLGTLRLNLKSVAAWWVRHPSWGDEERSVKSSPDEPVLDQAL